MKIAIVGLLHHPIAEPFAGGMESHTWWLAKKLIERGHDVTLFASGESDATLGLQPCIECSFETNSRAKTLLGRQACNMSAYAEVIRQVCVGSFDVVHNNALHPFLLTSAADLPTPMLTVLHTPIYKELAAAVQYAAARNTLGRLVAVCVSESLAAEWSALIPIGVVRNGIDVESWPFSPESSSDSSSSDSSSGFSSLGKALWYGRIVPEKAPHLAIQAAIEAGYQIEIAGPISDRIYFENNVQPLINNLTNSQQVRYLGHLPQSEIKQALAKAKVFINTSVWEEPYGLVYAEALASGTPVATFDSGAAKEILTDRCGVIAEERTVKALAKAVAAAAKLSPVDCRARAVSFCHIDTMIDAYEQLYRQLAQCQQTLNETKNSKGKTPPAAVPKEQQGFDYMQALVGIAT